MGRQIVENSSRSILVGLIGRGIKKSRTPAMHMAEAKSQDLNCDYRFHDLSDDIHEGKTLGAVLNQIECECYAGVNITYPFKIEIMALLDELSPNAQAVGAVNTVVFQDHKRIGYNTDMWGFAEGFRREFGSGPHQHTLLIGAGGAGAAVAHGLADCGVKQLSIYDTDLERATHLAAQISQTWQETAALPVEDISVLVARDCPKGIVNATPVGMAKLPGSAFPINLLSSKMWVADIVYFPLETELLRAARLKGCRTLDGSGMAVFQAVRAFQFFTGRPADPKRMKAQFDAFNTKASNTAD